MTGRSRRFLQLPPPQLLASSDPLPLAGDTPPASDLNPLSPDERVLDPVTKPETTGKVPRMRRLSPLPNELLGSGQRVPLEGSMVICVKPLSLARTALKDCILMHF